MENIENDYRISFFVPTTELARINRNLILVLITIWAVAIFGFHFLLRIVEEPVKEDALIKFEKVWDNVQSENTSDDELKQFIESSLSVLGKITIKPEHRAILDNGVSWATYNLVKPEEQEEFKSVIEQFVSLKSSITSLNDEEYKKAKQVIIDKLSDIVGLPAYSLSAKLLPLELYPDKMSAFTTANKEQYSKIMSLYTIHNQSFLTDFKFLGFPFHYFYTSVFLLILFVGLCWVYCKRIDVVHKKLKINETV